MKAFLAAILLAVVFAGCSKNNPVSANSDNTTTVQSEAPYSAISMYKTSIAVAAAETGVVSDTGTCPHDSLRNAHMLDSIKAYLSLTDEQFVQLKTLGDTLFAQLKAIRTLEIGKQISRDSAHVLVDQLRAQFLASVKLILTADQITLFETWITLYWDRPRHDGGGHGGPGGEGHGGPGMGHGGHHGGGMH